jgi:hypothetical protein
LELLVMATPVPDSSTLARWRADPASFTEHLINPETGKPFELLPAEREFLKHALATGPDGRLLYPELLYSASKKSGKTTWGAIFLLLILLVHGGRNAEGYVASNDYEQSVARVFEVCRRIIEASPLLKREARITADRIVFPSTGASVRALTASAASAAGGHPTIAVFDELWGFTTERSRRLFDELIFVPSRKVSCRLTVSYAGFSGESQLLEQLYQRGLEQPELGPDLRGGDGMLMFWSHQPIAPWQDERWLAEMRRSLRPAQYARMIENRFTASAEQAFVDMAAWDRCVTGPGPVAPNKGLQIYVGLDASTKLDSTAVCAVLWDTLAKQVRLVAHRVFVPIVDEAVNFEAVEAVLLDLHRKFSVRVISYDPWSFVASAQRLRLQGLPMREVPQTSANLTMASATLYELITSNNLVVYPARDLRDAIASATVVEGPRGMRIAKQTRNSRIDLVVALALACSAAMEGQSKPRGFLEMSGWESDAEDKLPGQSRADHQAVQSWCQAIHAYSNGMWWG